jgi:hypothetical protein
MSLHLSVLLFFGGLQVSLLVFFVKRGKIFRPGDIFLMLYFFVMLLQVSLKLLSIDWLLENGRALYDISYQLPFLYGPLIYLFTRQLLQRQASGWSDLIHFVPFALVVFFLLIGSSHAESPLMLFPFSLAKFRLLFQVVSLYIYHWFALQCWQDKLSLQRYIIKRRLSHGLKISVYISFFICCGISVLNYFMVVLHPGLDDVRPFFITLLVFIYWLGYQALYDQEAFSVVKGFARASDSISEQVPKLTAHLPVKKYLER